MKRMKNARVSKLISLLLLITLITASCVVIVDLPQKKIDDLKKEARKTKYKEVPTKENFDVDSLDFAVSNTKLTSVVKRSKGAHDTIGNMFHDIMSEPDTVASKVKAVDFVFFVDDMKVNQDSFYVKMREVRSSAEEFFVEKMQDKYPLRKILYLRPDTSIYNGKKLKEISFNSQKYSIPLSYYITEFGPDHPAGEGRFKYVVTFVYKYKAYR